MFCKSLNGKSQIVLAILGVAIFLGILGIWKFGWGTTRTYNIPFSQAEEFLLYRFGLDEGNLITRPNSVQAKVDSVLAEYMFNAIIPCAHR